MMNKLCATAVVDVGDLSAANIWTQHTPAQIGSLHPLDTHTHTQPDNGEARERTKRGVRALLIDAHTHHRSKPAREEEEEEKTTYLADMHFYMLAPSAHCSRYQTHWYCCRRREQIEALVIEIALSFIITCHRLSYCRFIIVKRSIEAHRR